MHCGVDFSPIADDRSIGHQPFDVVGGHRGHGRGIEVLKRLAQVVALVEDTRPRQAVLEVRQSERFEQRGLVVGRLSLFVIVIGGQIAARLGGPTAAGDTVGGSHDGGRLWRHTDAGHRLHVVTCPKAPQRIPVRRRRQRN